MKSKTFEEIGDELRELNNELKANRERHRQIIDEISHLIDQSHYQKTNKNNKEPF